MQRRKLIRSGDKGNVSMTSNVQKQLSVSGVLCPTDKDLHPVTSIVVKPVSPPLKAKDLQRNN